MSLVYTIVLEPEEDGGYSVHCPALPGCSSQGDTLAEALANIKEAILKCLKVLQQRGNLTPRETPDLVAEEIRQILADRADDALPLTIETRELELPAEAIV